MTDKDKIKEALSAAYQWSQIDGSHHKAWSIDQIVRALLGDEYEKWVTEYEAGEDGPNSYKWDCGIAP